MSINENNYVASNSNTDDASVVSLTCTDGNSIQQVGPKIVMADGSDCDDESISWWYNEDENENIIDKELAYVMDFTKYFPFWEELKAPEGYNHAVQVGDVWHWAVKENKIIEYPFPFFERKA